MGFDLPTAAHAVASVTFVIGTLTIFLRFYCRLVILQTWGLDDWMAILVLVVNIGQQVVLYKFLEYGCGRHIVALSEGQVGNIILWLFIEEIFYYFVHWVIKAAFLFFYLRLSPNKVFRFFVYLGMATNTGIFLANTLTAFFQCIPFDEILHPGTHPDAVCINRLVLLVAPSVLNIFQDLYILILPISTVWNLQMSLRRKIAVMSVIGFGASAVLVAALRLIPILELNSSPDLSYVLGKMVIVAAVEIQLAVVAVNLPAVKALYTRITGGSTADSGKGYTGDRGYKLSSMGSKGRKIKGSTGSVTRLERGITATESEEELFRQGGMGAHGAGIKVTTNVDVKTADLKEGDVLPKARYSGV